MKPSDKSEGMEQALTGLFGFDRREKITANKCVPPPIGCGGDATEFKDELSRREYTISGLCQKCQDSVFDCDEDEPVEPVYVPPLKPVKRPVGPNDWCSKDYQMICGSYEAEVRKYHKYVGKSGRIWLVADQINKAANIYVANNPSNTTSRGQGFEGFGGRTLTFECVDGEIVKLNGPWHTNADSLFDDTGVDVRATCLTRVVLGMDRDFGDSCYVTIIRDVVYKEDKPVLGSYDRYKEIIKQHPDAKVYYMESEGGSSSGQITEEDRK